MKKVLFLILLLITGAYAHPPTPPGKWKTVGGYIVNKSGDSTGIFSLQGDTAWFGGTLDMLRLSNNGATMFRIDTLGQVHLVNFKFPIADGTNNQVLKTDGSGVVSWAADQTAGGALDSAEIMTVVRDSGFVSVASDSGVPDGVTNFGLVLPKLNDSLMFRTLEEGGGIQLSYIAGDSSVKIEIPTNGVIAAMIGQDQVVMGDEIANFAAVTLLTTLTDANQYTGTGKLVFSIAPTFTGVATMADWLWATGGADAAYDPTDVPTNGQVLTWNTGGTTDWQTPGAASGIWQEVDGATSDTNRWIAPDGDTAAVFVSNGSGAYRLFPGKESDGSAGNMTIGVDTLYIGGEVVGILNGNGLTVNGSNELVSDLGTTIITGEITDGTILEADLNVTGDPTEGDILTFRAAGSNFIWLTLAELGIQPLDATLTSIAGGTIGEDLDNTAFPWADNEISSSTSWNSAVTHITSDGSDHTFIDQDVTSGSSPTFDATNITGLATGTVEQVHVEVRAGTSTIPKGNPVYATSRNAGGWYVVEIADASNSAMMPALAIAEVAITTAATVIAVVNGNAVAQNTDTITGGSINSPLYVKAGGGLTVTKPQGTNLVQKVGFIGRDHASAGIIQVVGAGRSNDLPNIANTKFWIGDVNGVPQEFTLSGDVTNTAGGAVTIGNDKIDEPTLDESGGSPSDNDVLTYNTAGTNFTWVTELPDANVVNTITASNYLPLAGGDVDSVKVDTVVVDDVIRIPTGTNPTTAAVGELADDTDDLALETYDGTRSVLIPKHFTFEKTIWNPDLITDSIKVFECDSLLHQQGIVIENISLLVSEDIATSWEFFIFTSADPPVRHDYVDTLTTGASDQFVSSSTFEDVNAQTLDMGQRLYVLTDQADDILWGSIKIRYYIKDGN